MKKYFSWLGTFAVVVIVFGTIYGATQQAQRNDADYPQVQIAEDTAALLDAGAKPTTLVLGKVNMNTSLSPFIVVYDKAGNPVAGSGYLNDRLPGIPMGVLTASANRTYHRVTWEPRNGLNFAAVTVASTNYYVMSARSLAIVQANEIHTFHVVGFGAVCAVVVLIAMYAISASGAAKSKSRK